MIMVRIFQKNKNEFAIGISMSCGHFDEILLYFVFKDFSIVFIDNNYEKRSKKVYHFFTSVFPSDLLFTKKKKSSQGL